MIPVRIDADDYQINGTTLAMTKKGSRLNDAMNPCLRQVMQSKFYAELCTKYKRLGFDDIECFANEFLEEEEEEQEDDDDEIDDDMTTTMAPTPAPSPGPDIATSLAGFDCSSGYCGCMPA